MIADTTREPLSVLLVEDNPADAELFTVRLRPHITRAPAPAVRVVHATTASGACEALRNARFDVVILDLSLPDARWLDGLHRVRAVADGVPVIVLTAMADERLAREALRAGAQDYVLKPPPDGRTLLRILRYASERQQLLKELDRAAIVSEDNALRWRMLAEIGQILAGTDVNAQVLQQVARVVVPGVAESFLVYVRGEDESGDLLEAVHVGEVERERMRAALEEAVSATGVIDDVRVALAATHGASGGGSDAASMLLARFNIENGIVVPVWTKGEVRGFVVLGGCVRRSDGSVDLEFGRSLADRIGLALQSARMMRETRRAIAVRNRAFGIVSHDLRNPLSTIQICAAALLDPLPASGVRNMAQIIQRSATWMQQIVQDLLDSASLDAGQLTLNRQPTPVSDVFASVQVMFTPVAEEENLEFIVEPAPDRLIDADPRRLSQVLTNLLSNAMKFTPAGGRVTLAARVIEPDAASDGRQLIRFEVSDTGPGIPPEDVVHVFDWFWHSRRAGRSGAGLGLAIARGLVEAHGGKLDVTTSPGAGSTFWFTVPAAADSPTSA